MKNEKFLQLMKNPISFLETLIMFDTVMPVFDTTIS